MIKKLALLAIVLFGACMGEKPNGFKKVTLDESKKIAENFIKNAPTYKFDGFDLELTAINTMRCQYCWEFIFKFSSMHGGYGDRTGKIVTQVITPHEARVIVQEGKISSAVIDGVWDEINQEMIKVGETEINRSVWKPSFY